MIWCFILIHFCVYPTYVFLTKSDVVTLLPSLQERHKWITPNILEIILRNSKKNNLDVRFICEVIKAESNGKSNATSCVGAMGYMQLMPCHTPAIHRNDPSVLYRPILNIEIGTAYLKWCLDKAKGNKMIALKNYNSGPSSSYYNWEYIAKILNVDNYLVTSL